MLLRTPLQAAAARIAGAAALLVVDDEQEAKTAVRDGSCDCMVTSLDEAVRILKIEVRRGAPASVCLHARPADVLAACVERVVCSRTLSDFPDPVLARRGTLPIVWQTVPRARERVVVWSTPARLSNTIMQGIGVMDRERERWLRRAPGTLGRELGKWSLLPMSDEEVRCFLQAVDDGGEPIHISIDGSAGRGGKREERTPKLL